MESANFSITVTNSSSIYRTVGELTMGALTFLVIIFMTITGNIMVTLAICTYRPLKKVQNYFLISLAVADLAVATLVMPLHVAKFFMDKWVFGLLLCQVWLTFDILTCTASILNLCAIALDRYWAITDPIEYANKRTPQLVGLMILGVWSVSALISVPPLIGWNDWTADSLKTSCELTSDRAFVVFSASGSFYIPLVVMTTVYIKIYVAARQRIITNRARTGAAKLATAKTKQAGKTNEKPEQICLIEMQATGTTTAAGLTPSPRTRKSGLSPRSPRKFPSGVSEGDRGKKSEVSSKSDSDDEDTGELKEQNSANQVADNECDEAKPIYSSAGALQVKKKDSEAKGAKAPVLGLFKKKHKISVSKEKKAAKTLAIIMGVFVLCWLPFFLMYVIMPFCSSCSMHLKIQEAITWLGYINSAINPVIYTIFNLDFRKAFFKFLCPHKSRLRQTR